MKKHKIIFLLCLLLPYSYAHPVRNKVSCSSKKRTSQDKYNKQCCNQKCLENSCMIGAFLTGFAAIGTLCCAAYYMQPNQSNDFKPSQNYI
jgi:beta-lactamase regulating signal transducer with metallopeptidase domain